MRLIRRADRIPELQFVPTMAEELVRKKRVRAGHRASTTHMINKAGELLAEEVPEASRLSQMRLSLQEKLDVLKHLDGEILDHVHEDNVAEEIEQADAFNEDIYAVMVKIEHLLKSTHPRVGMSPPPPSPSSRPVRDPVAGSDPPSRVSKVKLPKLTIQPFKGDLTAWTTFWDSYKAAIHDNTSLSDVNKFNYLRSLLQGPALDAVSRLTLTAANYKEAVSILEKRFGNKQQIVAKHMEMILNIDPVTSTYNLKALRQLYNAVKSHVRGLKLLGVSSDSYGSLLSSVLLTKLPQELRLIISRKVGGDDWKLDKLMELLEEVRARDRAAASSTMSLKKCVKGPPTAAALLTGGPDTGPTYCYCQQPHPSHSCRAVESIEERRRILRGAGRCFVCLRRGHIGRHCQSNTRCPHCHGRHHGSICQKGSSQMNNKPKTSGCVEVQLVSTAPQSGMNPAAPVFQPPTSTALWTNINQAVLLQTAQASVFNPDDPHRSKRVHVVLDSGSQ